MTYLLSYPEAEREGARRYIKSLELTAEVVRKARARRRALAPEQIAAVEAVTGTADPKEWFARLNAAADAATQQHVARLTPDAYEHFPTFCEVINPREAPTKPWLRFLTDTLQAVESDDVTDPRLLKLAEEQGVTEIKNIILNCPPGHAKPLALATRILMGDGSWKPLGEVEVDDEVVTRHGRARRVTAVHEQGELPLVRLTTRDGRVVEGAADHPFLVDTAHGARWIDMGQVRPLDKLVVQSLHDQTPDYGLYEGDGDTGVAFAHMLGFVDACCSISTTLPRNARPETQPFPVLRLFSSNIAIVQQARGSSERMGWNFKVYANRRQGGYACNLAKAARDELAEWTDVFAPAAERRVPNRIFSAPRAMRAAYAAAVVNAKGETVKKVVGPNIYLYARSLELLCGLQRLMDGLGVQTAVERPPEGTDGRPCLVWREEACRAYVAAVAPFQGYAQDVFDARMAEPARGQPMGLDARRALADTVELLGRSGPCRCITVEEDASFVAEGLVVHNSTYASRYYVAWRMGRNPDLKVLGAGHTQNFVEKQFSKVIQDLCQSPGFKAVFPDFVIDYSSRAKDEWKAAGSTGQYVAKGVGQAIHGYRFNFVLVDDPYPSISKAHSPAYRQEVKTFVLGDIGTRILPGGKQFVVMTRFHAEDVTQSLIEMNQELDPADRFLVIAVPAICHDPDTDVLGRAAGELLWDFYSTQHFIAQRAKLGFAQFSLVHQQVVDATSEDSIASRFQMYDQAPHLAPEVVERCTDKEGRLDLRAAYTETYRRVIMSVDLAAKETQRADYTVAQVWAETKDKKHFLLDQLRFKLEFTPMIGEIERFARKHAVDAMLVEDKGQGIAYIQARGRTEYQSRLAPVPVIPISVSSQQGKSFRFNAIEPMIESGEVWLPKVANIRDRWMDAFLVEVGQFPGGAHDDQVDAMTQYLNWVRSKRSRGGTRKIASTG